VTAFDGVDDALVPTAFVAVTVNVYSVQLLRPVTVAVVVLEVAEIPPGAAATV